MLTVHLVGLRFFSFHGVYPEEAVLGNDFEVSVQVDYDDTGVDLSDLDAVVNYELLFKIVQERMSVPTPLLETIAESIIKDIRVKYGQVRSVSLSIFKLNAPITGLRGKLGITLTRQF